MNQCSRQTTYLFGKKTFYIKIKDTKHFEYYKSLILNADWCKMYKMTGTPNLLQWQLYKYVKENKPRGD